ncbi:peptidoglycan-binding protein [Marinactinospora rubrisoli]|uniref:Peptidoglycan-binding protein n=1 Tax=Marinactinospora rubrisoli TaxID=2715399 RepID=A0ABW2KKJ9_9ACTN
MAASDNVPAPEATTNLEFPVTRERGNGATGSRRSRRRLVLGLVAAIAVAVGAGVPITAAAGFGTSAEEPVTTFDGATDEVVRGPLEGSTTASGTLRFSDPRTMQAARDGVITALPTAGSVLALGDRIYAVDDVPVFLLRGSTPAWRDFEIGMSDGPDVKQLEESLQSLGYFDEEPDDEFTWPTANAIDAWQKEEGMQRTGRLPLGSVVFASGDLRIGNLTAREGDQVGPGAELFDATGTSQIVDVDLALADQQLAVIGREVVVRLPGNTETTGEIASVGTPTESEDEGRTVIPIVVTLDDPDAAASFQEASVSVDVPSERRADVLSIPVGALIALDPDQYGIEVVDADGTTRQVPVTTGLFAAGRVEISGEGVAEGQRVVVPQR